MILCGLLDLPLRKEGKSVIYTEAGLQDLYCLVHKPSLIGGQCLGPKLFHAPESPPARCEPNGRGNTILLHQKYLIQYFFPVYVVKLCKNSNEFKIQTQILKTSHWCHCSGRSTSEFLLWVPRSCFGPVPKKPRVLSELVKRVQSRIQKVVSAACAQITAAMQSATRSEISTFRLLFRQEAEKLMEVVQTEFGCHTMHRQRTKWISDR